MTKAFTLTELLVVLAVIALLAAALFPVYASALHRSHSAVCVSNERQIALAVEEYCADYDSDYPAASYRDGTHGWLATIAPYVKADAVYRCPDDHAQAGSASYVGNGLLVADAWPLTCQGVFCTASWYAQATVRSAGDILRASDTVLATEEHDDIVKRFAPDGGEFIDSGDVLDGFGYMDGNPGFGEIPNGTIDPASPFTCGYPNGPDGAVTATHEGRANVLYCDGHVRSVKPVDTDPDPVNLPDCNQWNGARQ